MPDLSVSVAWVIFAELPLVYISVSSLLHVVIELNAGLRASAINTDVQGALVSFREYTTTSIELQPLGKKLGYRLIC